MVRRRGGAPQVHVRGEPTDIALSLTHDGGLAIAVAVSRGQRRTARAPRRYRTASCSRIVPTTATRERSVAWWWLRDPRTSPVRRASLRWEQRVAAPASSRSASRSRSTRSSPPGVSRSCRRALPDAGTGVLHPDALATIRERMKGADALVIGPGLGRAPETVSALLELLVGLPCPAVVDADALNIVAASGFDWKRCEAERRHHAAPRGDGPARRDGYQGGAGGSPRDRPRVMRTGTASWSC